MTVTRGAQEEKIESRIGQRISLKAFAAIAIATFLSLGLLALLLPHDPYIRYQSLKNTIHWRAQWIYERIHFDPEPITVAFFGSSRTNSAVSAQLLEAELSKRGVPDPRVANFSLAASGFDLRYSLVRELLETKKVELVVFSVVEQMPRDGHDAFAEVARLDEVLGATWLLNRNQPRNLVYMPMREMKLAWTTQLAAGLGYSRHFDPATYLGTTYDKWFTVDLPEGQEVPVDRNPSVGELRQESAFRRRTLTPPVLPWPLRRWEFGVSRYYLEKIARLCEESGTKLRILYLPFYEGWKEPLDLDYLEHIAPVINAGFYRNDPHLFNDVAHVNRRGAELLAPWLADEIAPLLKR